jgi:hypothetical protein
LRDEAGEAGKREEENEATQSGGFPRGRNHG